MNYTPEVNLGSILMIVTLIVSVAGGFYGIKGKIGEVGVALQANNERINRLEVRHEQRMTKLEDNDHRLTEIVQQLIGQHAERSRWDGPDRRTTTRRQ